MSSIFLYSKYKDNTLMLELSSSQEVKNVFKRIKASMPKASIGVYGARDFATLQRTHRNLTKYCLYKNVDDFIARIIAQ
ncbi:hypothetical protein [Desulfotomaculum nigrificans]|uniref:hypothetical protein n=1 Tax=Desulfotomaculum nigrificans TaxID=1565 RepID=UPI0001FAE78F|nr:hypothetical protein [Desulfotomaculum nigrificans]